jgi:hypothetical protein
MRIAPTQFDTDIPILITLVAPTGTFLIRRDCKKQIAIRIYSEILENV